MTIVLPEFDVLQEMAEKDPEGLEQLRRELCDQLIQNAPAAYRRKLRGLQFRVDMERRRAKNPMSACIAISAMMHDSFDQLRHALNEAAGQPTPSTGRARRAANPEAADAKVLPFRRA